jgi:hypothetical protein
MLNHAGYRYPFVDFEFTDFLPDWTINTCSSPAHDSSAPDRRPKPLVTSHTSVPFVPGWRDLRFPSHWWFFRHDLGPEVSLAMTRLIS